LRFPVCGKTSIFFRCPWVALSTIWTSTIQKSHCESSRVTTNQSLS